MRICEFEGGCEKTVLAKALCTGHYNQQRLGKQLTELRYRSPDNANGGECSFSGCEKNAYARGLCRGHYSQWNRGVPLTKLWDRIRGGCSFSGCNRPHEAHGLCKAHYNQQKRGAKLQPVQYQSPKRKKRPPAARCGVDDCAQDGAHGGWCKRHNRLDEKYWQKFGMDLTEAQEVLRAQGGVCALCDHPISFTGDSISKKCTARLDHDHAGDGITVRGALCDLCNKIEGFERRGHWSLEKFAARLEAYRARGRT